MTTKTTRYSLENITNILFNGFDYKLPEETLNIIKYGTKNSLAILDELGRGTSTFDGVSIAYSVLNHIHDKIQ